MKDKMITKIIIRTSILIFFISLFAINFISAEGCILTVTLVNQDPSPAVPGEYVDIVFQVSGLQNPECEGAIFELIPSYPFSMDSNETSKTIYGSTWVSGYKTDWTIPYKLKVDKDAYNGEYKLTIKYGENEENFGYIDFDISVEDSRTSFDAVIQDSTSSEVSIAIANIGKNTANSVIVKIPQQDNFIVTGTDGQMVGNLESGDYSVVSFEISKKMSQLQYAEGEDNNEKNFQMPTSQSENLTFDIYYTDLIGVRRVISMQSPVYMTSSNFSAMTDTSGFGGRKSSSISWYIYLIIIILLFISFFIIHKKFPKQTQKFLDKINPKKWSKKKESQKSEIPDWVKKTKDREKNK